MGIALHFADDALILVDKPAGLLSVPGRGPEKADCAAARVQARFPDALIVHRLDMATSGLLLFARGAAIQRALSIAFLQREVDKRYVAVVNGIVEPDSGEIGLPLITDWPNRPRQMVSFELGKPSLTRYRVLSRSEQTQTTRIALTPVTGRSHQLRVHMQQLGHPILGDDLYADEAARGKATRLLLHAQALAFAHPVTGEPIAFESPAPF